MSKKLKNIVRSALLFLFLLVAGAVSAQQTITGTVIDGTGEPIIGATVIEQGTQNGAVTDIDGNYSLSLTGGGKKAIVFSYVGMKSKTINPAGKSVINVTLEDDSQGLNEVVVIGYGTVRKKDLTGAVASISSEKLADIPVSNVGEAMTGKLAGVNITTTEGSPDADIKIRVRGGGSLSQDNSPLYIVDGFPVSSISDIAPSEIQSIDVLKDASSTAIYGARGANGVIIVTTKSGSEGKTQVSFNANYGWKKITKEIKVMSPYNYALYQYELGGKDHGNYEDMDIWKSVDGSNWQDEVFGRTGHQTQYNTNVSGGTKDLKFNVGFNHNDEKSIMMGSGYSKNNVSAKINANLNKWLSLDFNGRMAFTKLDGLNGGADTNESNAANSIVANTVRWAPVETLSSSDDDEDEENSTSVRRTPYQRITATYKFQERFQQNYNVGLNWKPWKHFTFRTEFGYGWRYNNTDQVWASDATTNSKYGYNGAPQSQFIRVNNQNWRNANTVTYDNRKLFGGDHHLNILLGQEWSSTKQTTRTSTSVGYPTSMTIDEVLANTAAGIPLDNEGTIAAKENLLSFFGRINYTMADKYLATFTMRADGSSKFGDGHRWGVFPSLALAWRMSEESFLKDSKWLDNLKLRLSFGTAGNNRINSGLIATTYSMSGNTGKAPFFGEDRASMLQHGTYLYNPDLKWETTVTRNLGLDFGFFRSRINGTLDFYWNTTNDLLMRSVVPSNSGYSYQYQNFGKTSNKGVELTLNAVLIDTKKVNLNFNFNISYNKNKIEELAMDNPWATYAWAGSTMANNDNFRLEQGGRLGEIWGYKTNGFYTVYNPETGTGDLIYNGRAWELANGGVDNSYTLFGGNLYPGVPKVELDGNGDPLKQRLGNTIAPTTGGFGFDGRIGNLDFNVFLNYSLGNKLVNGTKLANAFYAGSARNYNLVDDFNVDNRYTWIDPATGLNLGRPSASTLTYYGSAEELMARLNELNQNANIYNPCGVTAMQLIDYAVEDASFLRLQNVTIGYTLPKIWVNKLYIQSVRIYATGYNLLTFTGYDGYDPEVDTSSKSNPMCPGIDYAAYPKSRSYVIGINVTF